MRQEIEAKLKVDSTEQIAILLAESGAKLQGQSVQTDCYFDDARRSLAGADSALRLRRQQSGDKQETVLTFKGPREKSRLKRRNEIQVRLEDSEAAQGLLEALGFEKKIVFQKRRQLWQLGGCEVALDELPLLGAFVEIEGPDEAGITRVQEELKLGHLPHIPHSYLALMQEELARLGIETKQVLFSPQAQTDCQEL
jgi:adenylate cyclase class 2